ncbi:MAG: hypothetical protein E7053_01430 [Lentisphaerae bacterium]|nr:hypothetical protein [Lentisphaerota bacterium]
MSKLPVNCFVDVHYLDYANPNNILCRQELKKLQHFSMLFRCRAADFLIRNNISRRDNGGRAIVFRITFKDIWPWHIHDEIGRIIEFICQSCFTDATHSWDCLWILKSQKINREELLFGDIIFFGDKNIPDAKLDKVLVDLNYNQDYIDKAILLFPDNDIRENYSELQKLCAPTRSCNILQCEFAHNIPR